MSSNNNPFGRHYGPLQELLDFAVDEIPYAALTPEMIEALTWFNGLGATPERLQKLIEVDGYQTVH
jgi:hypothetical protein